MGTFYENNQNLKRGLLTERQDVRKVLSKE
jgi:hypothetical protein